MKKFIITAGAVAALVVPAGTASATPPSCNWGQATATAIAHGFDQGDHASSYAGSPRAGLANVVERGNLNATCELVS